jgi:predicted ATPase/DNA-binding winged helix-turn-helix (wHTH) protein
MQWRFGQFCLDREQACLWEGDQRLTLRPKTFELLLYLVTHAGELVRKETLLVAIWPDTAVTEGVLTTSLGELRKVLGETAKQPQYIATVPRRGYRFIAPVTPVATAPAASGHRVLPQATAPWLVGEPSDALGPRPILVDRETELTQLQQWFQRACHGHRQVVFVTGEAGIGKTTLVDAFLTQIATYQPLQIGRGQCLDHYGAGEAYLPLLEALGQMGQGAQGAQVIDVLRQHAPSWLLQLPALWSTDELPVLQQRALGATRERMLRELAEAVEALAHDRSLVFVLEDLHWSDVSTLDWVAYVARRRAPARLLVLGTYRPIDAVVRDHPIRTLSQELRIHGQCAELALEYLSRAGVAAYLARCFTPAALPERLAQSLYHRTNGNPLFLVAMVESLVHQGILRRGVGGWELAGDFSVEQMRVPEGLRQLIMQQFERLTPGEQALLETASVAGIECAVAAVAASLDHTVAALEAQCATLARRRQFLRPCGTDVWPDGTVATRYRFLHDLYRETFYERIPAGQRARAHQRIGARLEAGYGTRAREMAAELAEHFVRGHDTAQAVQYLQYAGENALQRNAYQEALRHLTQALELLHTLPDTPARLQQELILQRTLGVPLVATKGYAAPEVEQTYARAHTLCRQVGDTQQISPVLFGLWRFYSMRGDLQTAREVAEQLFTLAQSQNDPVLLMEAHRALGIILSWCGELVAARTHLEQVIALYDRQQHPQHAYHSGLDVGVACLSMLSIPLWMLGYPDQALERSNQALTLARELAHPFSIAFALINAARFHHFRREWHAVQAHAEALLGLATEQEFALWIATGTRWRGVALAAQGQPEVGIALIRQGQTAYQASGSTLGEPYYLALLAEAYGDAGQSALGLRILDEALASADKTADRIYEAEVYRLKGKLLLAHSETYRVEAESCFHLALTVARRQQAKSLELRTAVGLSRLWQQHGKRHEARQLLGGVYSWFTEGFDTADLQEARALLEDLA